MPFRKRPAYRYVVKNSIYVHPDHLHAGVGRKLLPALIEACAGAGFRQMIACIDAGNVPSLCLHEGFGFARIGELKGVGFKYGRWTDVDPCLPLLVADAKSPHTKRYGSKRYTP